MAVHLLSWVIGLAFFWGLGKSKKISLPVQIIVSIVMGILVGLYLPQAALSLAPLGDVFIRLLKMIIVPLVLASIVMGVVSLGDIRQLKSIGTKTVSVFFLTTLVAVTVGLVTANVIDPGINSSLQLEQSSFSRTAPDLKNVLISIIPKNVVSALAEGNMLSIIFFAVLMGCALISIGDEGTPLIKVFKGLDTVMMNITHWIMALAPIGVFSLMSAIVAQTGTAAFGPLAKYMLTVLIGLVIYSFIIAPIILIIFGKYSPKTLFQKMFTSLATGFSTSSSGATMPITMDLLTSKVGVSQRVVGFSLPLGTTINMDGTALYQAVATVFIAQLFGIELGLIHYIVISITAVLASIGAAAIPSAGLITLVMILNAVNVPVEGIGLILAVDRILDMFRTTTNIWGNTISAVIVARLEGETLQK